MIELLTAFIVAAVETIASYVWRLVKRCFGKNDEAKENARKPAEEEAKAKKSV